MNTYKNIKISILLIFIIQFSQFAYASGVRVGWVENSESDVAGYNVYYGTASRNYQTHVDAGPFTSVELDGLNSGTTYYLAVTAYDYTGNESAYSQEIQATIPVALAVNTDSGSGSSPVSGSGSVSSSSSSSNTSSSSGSGNVAASTTYTLSTSVVNAFGTISVAQSTETYPQGTIVNLTAAPDSGFQLMAWTGTDNDTSISNSNTVTMDADRTVSVEFEPVSNTEENKDGGGGGCFISTSVSNGIVIQGMPLFILMSIVLIGFSRLAGKLRSN